MILRVLVAALVSLALVSCGVKSNLDLPSGAQPDRRAGVDRRAQHVSRRKLHQTMRGHEPLRLRAFAGPRRAKQDQSHLRRPRSFDRLIRPSY